MASGVNVADEVQTVPGLMQQCRRLINAVASVLPEYNNSVGPCLRPQPWIATKLVHKFHTSPCVAVAVCLFNGVLKQAWTFLFFFFFLLELFLCQETFNQLWHQRQIFCRFLPETRGKESLYSFVSAVIGRSSIQLRAGAFCQCTRWCRPLRCCR